MQNCHNVYLSRPVLRREEMARRLPPLPAGPQAAEVEGSPGHLTCIPPGRRNMEIADKGTKFLSMSALAYAKQAHTR